MRTALFLGAGASVFALQPTTEVLLKTLLSKTELDPTVRNLLSTNALYHFQISNKYMPALMRQSILKNLIFIK